MCIRDRGGISGDEDGNNKKLIDGVLRNRIADTLLNEEKRNKLFDWLRKHNVQIDPEFEEKLKKYQKIKERCV